MEESTEKNRQDSKVSYPEQIDFLIMGDTSDSAKEVLKESLKRETVDALPFPGSGQQENRRQNLVGIQLPIQEAGCVMENEAAGRAAGMKVTEPVICNEAAGKEIIHDKRKMHYTKEEFGGETEENGKAVTKDEIKANTKERNKSKYPRKRQNSYKRRCEYSLCKG